MSIARLVLLYRIVIVIFTMTTTMVGVAHGKWSESHVYAPLGERVLVTVSGLRSTSMPSIPRLFSSIPGQCTFPSVSYPTSESGDIRYDPAITNSEYANHGYGYLRVEMLSGVETEIVPMMVEFGHEFQKPMCPAYQIDTPALRTIARLVSLDYRIYYAIDSLLVRTPVEMPYVPKNDVDIRTTPTEYGVPLGIIDPGAGLVVYNHVYFQVYHTADRRIIDVIAHPSATTNCGQLACPTPGSTIQFTAQVSWVSINGTDGGEAAAVNLRRTFESQYGAPGALAISFGEIVPVAICLAVLATMVGTTVSCCGWYRPWWFPNVAVHGKTYAWKSMYMYILQRPSWHATLYAMVGMGIQFLTTSIWLCIVGILGVYDYSTPYTITALFVAVTMVFAPFVIGCATRVVMTVCTCHIKRKTAPTTTTHIDDQTGATVISLSMDDDDDDEAGIENDNEHQPIINHINTKRVVPISNSQDIESASLETITLYDNSNGDSKIPIDTNVDSGQKSWCALTERYNRWTRTEDARVSWRAMLINAIQYTACMLIFIYMITLMRMLESPREYAIDVSNNIIIISLAWVLVTFILLCAGMFIGMQYTPTAAYSPVTDTDGTKNMNPVSLKQKVLYYVVSLGVAGVCTLFPIVGFVRSFWNLNYDWAVVYLFASACAAMCASAMTSFLVVYRQLCMGNPRWHWLAFHMGGSGVASCVLAVSWFFYINSSIVDLGVVVYWFFTAFFVWYVYIASGAFSFLVVYFGLMKLYDQVHTA